jgi:hypothetical protein
VRRGRRREDVCECLFVCVYVVERGGREGGRREEKRRRRRWIEDK